MTVCETCSANAGELTTPGGVLYQDEYWRLEHMFEPVPLVGWLVLKPLVHRESFADLSADEAATFGPLVQRITAAMTQVLAPERVYLSLYDERGQIRHVHFHLIPRYPNVPVERYGPGIFDYLREARAGGKNLAEMAEVLRATAAIRALLAAA